MEKTSVWGTLIPRCLLNIQPMSSTLHVMRTIKFLSHRMALVQQPIPLVSVASFSIGTRYFVLKYTIIFNIHKSSVGVYMAILEIRKQSQKCSIFRWNSDSYKWDNQKSNPDILPPCLGLISLCCSLLSLWLGIPAAIYCNVKFFVTWYPDCFNSELRNHWLI